MHCNVCSDKNLCSTNLCDRRLTHIIRKNKTHAEKCHFTVQQICTCVCILSFLAAALLEDLIGYEEIQQPILMGLVGMLKATEDGPTGTAPSATSVPNPLLGTL